MNTYVPGMKALWMAENLTGLVHNIYTLRGAQVRDSLRWSKFIRLLTIVVLTNIGGFQADDADLAHHRPRRS